MKDFSRIMKMFDANGFDQLFEREIPNHTTYKEAFQSLNREFKDVTGRKRYSNYESYRKSREKRIKA